MAGVVMSPESGGLGFDETELRLGLPGGDGGGDVHRSTGKRGFSETIDLKLKLHTREEEAKDDSKDGKEKMMMMTKKKTPPMDPAKPPAPKAQVVGWPPVRSFRKNALSTHSSKVSKDDVERPTNGITTVAAFVKVSMDGAPYLRKVDLKMYKSYQDLSFALEKMFNSFTSGSQGMHGRDFMNESKLMDLLHGSDYVPTYEDKDGDWMLVGDVPWEMFVDSCKRIRIMKGSEAIGIAPRAMEKCKNMS